MLNYIAVIHKDENSDYGVSFPDIPGCITTGSNLEEAKTMANEALNLHLNSMIEDGEDLPEPSDLDNLNLNDKFKDSIHAFLVIDYSPRAKKPELKRINITLDETLVEKADLLATQYHTSRSGLIADLIKNQFSDNNVLSKNPKSS